MFIIISRTRGSIGTEPSQNEKVAKRHQMFMKVFKDKKTCKNMNSNKNKHKIEWFICKIFNPSGNSKNDSI